jgi:hypothetical protein
MPRKTQADTAEVQAAEVQNEPTPTVQPVEYRPPENNSVVEGHRGRLYPSKDLPLHQCPSNIDHTTYRGKQLLLAAGNPSDIVFDQHGTATIYATNYLIFPDEGVDPETGEIRTYARTCLFTKDGLVFRTTSAHAPHRIAAACDLFGPLEWAAGIPFLIRERRSHKTGRTYHDIRLGDQPPCNTPNSGNP